MMIDVGNGNDRYGFGQSTGMGGADQGGWGLFIEEGGSDEYEAKSGFGRTPDASVAGFFDLNGKDGYRLSSPLPVPQDQQPADGKVILYPTGGVFTDR
jgi:hypothetical protein